MSDPTSLQPDPSVIGGIATAPFGLLPEPTRLFTRRAERFDHLARDGALSPYLGFLGQLSRVQADLAGRLPAPEPVPLTQRDRAREHAMPPLDRSGFAGDRALDETLEAFFDAAAAVAKPAAATDALDLVRQAGPEALVTMVDNVAADAIPFEGLATHLYVAAGMQVHAARRVATLVAADLVPLGVGLCPACGGPPVCSVVVGFMGADGARYAACSFCGTLWNEVRIKCLACGSTKGVGYRAVETGGGEDATVKAEVCDECRSWVKILYQNRNPSLDPVADDVASLGLDVMMRDTEYRRAGFDPFLLGY